MYFSISTSISNPIPGTQKLLLIVVGNEYIIKFIIYYNNIMLITNRITETKLRIPLTHPGVFTTRGNEAFMELLLRFNMLNSFR